MLRKKKRNVLFSHRKHKQSGPDTLSLEALCQFALTPLTCNTYHVVQDSPYSSMMRKQLFGVAA